MWVWSLEQEYPLKEGMTTHSSILAWRIPWTAEPGGLQSMGSQSWTQWSNSANAPHCVGTFWGTSYIWRPCLPPNSLSHSLSSFCKFQVIIKPPHSSLPLWISPTGFFPVIMMVFKAQGNRKKKVQRAPSHSEKWDEAGPVLLPMTGQFPDPLHLLVFAATLSQDPKERSSPWSSMDSLGSGRGSGKWNSAWFQKCLPDCSY